MTLSDPDVPAAVVGSTVTLAFGAHEALDDGHVLYCAAMPGYYAKRDGHLWFRYSHRDWHKTSNFGVHDAVPMVVMEKLGSIGAAVLASRPQQPLLNAGELLPCPFCGARGPRRETLDSGLTKLVCRQCGGSTGAYSDPGGAAEAVFAWNRRQTSEAP